MTQPPQSAKPVLKWVGGKSQLVETLVGWSPRTIGRYFEPFLGGGALFFRTCPQNAFLSDSNERLIRFYQSLRDDPHALLARVATKEKEFNELDTTSRKTWFYEQRDAFNADAGEKIEMAALFLALNKTAFNGLYRENSSGQFNVPFNQASKTVRFCQKENFFAASQALSAAKLTSASFDSVLKEIRSNDFVYFDPPYVPISKTSDFTGYAAKGFDMRLQERLVEVAKECSDRGAHVLLSNSYTQWVKSNYEAAGFKVEKVLAKRLVAARASSRTLVYEAVIHNA
ncbi:MAG: Dam family site-specific DNA-(adenine-N6)-methyltransferase [Actinobacteria bacterium]|nr:Dam family site-specific DNA-(adenine-N6)-methyltransferase [Actinomycetota bacterium]